MNRREHLLTILGEECSELHQVCCKTLRFGIQDKHTGETKLDWLNAEFNDLLAMIEMLKGEGIIMERNEDAIAAKILKVEHFLLESKAKGTLQ